MQEINIFKVYYACDGTEVTFTIRGNNKLSNWMKTEPTTDYPSLRKNGTFCLFEEQGKGTLQCNLSIKYIFYSKRNKTR